MKAREIKKKMLENYKDLVASYEYDIGQMFEKRARIRIAEQDLAKYFSIEVCYKFTHE